LGEGEASMFAEDADVYSGYEDSDDALCEA
jgi:hypothetical protein